MVFYNSIVQVAFSRLSYNQNIRCAVPFRLYDFVCRYINLVLRFVIAMTALILANSALAEDEVSLFNSIGKPEAYIDIDDGLTIYLWSGKPVAYLENDSSGYHVYGFNGKHLGWFVQGIIRDHHGNASCAVKEAFSYTEYEPYKSYKQYKPYKSYTQYAPYRPYFSNNFGDFPCRFLLGEGAK